MGGCWMFWRWSWQESISGNASDVGVCSKRKGWRASKGGFVLPVFTNASIAKTQPLMLSRLLGTAEYTETWLSSTPRLSVLLGHLLQPPGRVFSGKHAA